MKFIKSVLTLLTISLGLSLNAQTNAGSAKNVFENKSFGTNQIIGYKDSKYNPNVSPIELYQLDIDYPYGFITSFQNGKFTSENSGPCGNECRVTVSGNYSVKKNKIYLFVEKISFWKECKHKPTQIINKKIGAFVWEEGENGSLKLIKKE